MDGSNKAVPCGLQLAPTGIIVMSVSGILCMVLAVVGLCFAMRVCAQLRLTLRRHGQGSAPAPADQDGDLAVTALPCHEHSPQHDQTASTSQTSDQDETPAATSRPAAIVRLVMLLFCAASACIGLAAGLALAPMRFKG